MATSFIPALTGPRIFLGSNSFGEFAKISRTVARAMTMRHKVYKAEFNVYDWVAVMTCYFRHLKEVFLKADIEVTPENKHEIDKIIQGLLGVECKNCPATWREIKERLAQDESKFVSTLKQAWGNR